MKKKKRLETEFLLDNLKYLLEDLAANGITKKDYHKVEFVLDYTGCFYESDTPSIKAIIYD